MIVACDVQGVFDRLLVNSGGLSLQPYVHPDCGAHYGVPFEEETPEMFVVSAHARNQTLPLIT